MRSEKVRAPRWTLRAAGSVSLLLCFATACGGSEFPSETPTPTKTVTEAVEAPVENETSVEQAALPDMVGEVLQDAQDSAQANGFYLLDSTDATGAGRYQVLDRNWVVCSQTPEPGTHPIDVTVSFNVVKIDEVCP